LNGYNIKIKILNEKFPINDTDQNIIKKRSESSHFHCMRCRSIDMQKSEVGYYANGSNVSPSDEDTFFVTGILYCKRCKHNFSVRFTDMKRE
jgi:hypothetical protein